MEGSSLLGCYKTHYNSFFFNPPSSSSSSRYYYHYYSTTTTTNKAMSDWQPQFHTHQQEGQEQEQQQHTTHSSSTIHMPPVDKTGRFCSPAESPLCMPPPPPDLSFLFLFFPSRERVVLPPCTHYLKPVYFVRETSILGLHSEPWREREEITTLGVLLFFA